MSVEDESRDELLDRLSWIAFNAESWHGGEAAKERALVVIAAWARGGTLPEHPAPRAKTTSAA